MKRCLALLLTLQMVVAPLAHGEAICQNLFLKDVGLFNILKNIDRENNHFLQNQSENFVFDFPKEQKSFLRRFTNNVKYRIGLEYDRQQKMLQIVQSANLEKLTLSTDIESLASEMSLVLFGPRYQVMDYLRKSSDERFRESTLHRIGEGILRDGLMRSWNEIDHKSPGLWTRFSAKLWRVQKLFLQIPFFKMKDKPIPPELMQKVILEGFDAHEQELREALSTQNYRDTYNTFRRVGLTLMWTLIIGAQVVEVSSQVSLELDRHAMAEAQEVRQARALSGQVREFAQGGKQRIFERAFAEGNRKFLADWGEPPTSDEQQELYGQIVVFTFAKQAEEAVQPSQ